MLCESVFGSDSVSRATMLCDKSQTHVIESDVRFVCTGSHVVSLKLKRGLFFDSNESGSHVVYETEERFKPLVRKP